MVMVKVSGFGPVPVVDIPAKKPAPLLNGEHGVSKLAWTTECVGAKY